MTLKIAINGYGRIGRNILRALYESQRTDEIQILAINDLGDAESNAHLTRYDSAHGPFPVDVEVDPDGLIVGGDRIRVFAERDPTQLPWRELGVDLVLECTGLFASKKKASAQNESSFLWQSHRSRTWAIDQQDCEKQPDSYKDDLLVGPPLVPSWPDRECNHRPSSAYSY